MMKKTVPTPIGEYMKNIRIIEFMLVDAFGLAFTYSFVILALRWTGVENFDSRIAFLLLPMIIAFKIVVYTFLKLYKLILDNVGLDEVFRISIGVVVTNLVIATVFLSISNFQFIPEIYLILTTFIEIITLAIPRMMKRIFRYMTLFQRKPVGRRTLLIGAGAGGKLVLNEMRENPELHNRVIAFVDDDENKIGKIMSGYKVLGPISRIPEFIDLYQIEEVVITIASIGDERFQEIIQYAAQRPVKIKRIPKFKDISKDAPKKLLEVKVEDLLSRDIVELDDQGICDFIHGKKVLVTGAGGSIGSELVRQIIRYQPKEILLLDIYENGVYDLQMELGHFFKDEIIKSIPRKVLIGSVYNHERMNEIFSEFRPELVFHAAAYKHVPLMESSAVESVRTNVIGTYNICQLSDQYGVEKMVLVSSDKAVRPTNVMGATKRFAEIIMQNFNRKSKTQYAAVRFGNVLGSNGSVVPLFRKQIEHGGPITVTDKDIIRYFMTIPEAVGLILQASTFAKGGEIFILDMGDPVKIVDLAEKMIRLSGLRPYQDIQIEFTGLRPGEKLYEELLVDKEDGNIQTENKKIFIENSLDERTIEDDIETIRKTFETLENEKVKEMVQSFVPTYTIKR
ncbi:MAG: nucleoside-diphosphate sugar epimerase/dehydratase [Candidatus Izemoplasmatales bacterium]|nr:nucleoside-diphosphate sugar epimerase/dehydratase [Candidatus Izemoplasmatales bacterium]